MSIKDELREATDRILESTARRKLVVAGPGTGKTYLFRKLLERKPGNPQKRLALTFINNLKDDLAASLEPLASARTLHGYCMSVLKRRPSVRPDLSDEFVCQPGLASLIKSDWSAVFDGKPPSFIGRMRTIAGGGELDFYFKRSAYYDAVDFDDSVYRVYKAWLDNPTLVEEWELLLVDEFQDFNPLEAAVILQLAEKSSIVIVGDDDQALYSKLRSASWDAIRELHGAEGFEPFELPFCMRCTEVVVGAVEDVVTRAHGLGHLAGRIQKPYRYYPPKKGPASAQYPRITLAHCSVQNQRANYFGRFVAQQLGQILPEEVQEAQEDGDPPALVIGPRYYLDAIASYLDDAGYSIDYSRRGSLRLRPEDGLKILQSGSNSNLGWRIVLEFEEESFRGPLIRSTLEDDEPLVRVLTEDYRAAKLREAAELEELEDAEETRATNPLVKLTTFEGAKGLSAQHVFLVGLHENELPRHADGIEDLEICRFVVGLTRAKKNCCILLTDWFANRQRRRPSPFLSWIRPERFKRIRVDRRYWYS